MGAKGTGDRKIKTKPDPPPLRASRGRRETVSAPESYARLKAMLDALPDTLFVVDRQGRICDYHAPDPDRLYVPPEQFLGRKIQDVLPEPAAGIVRQAIASAAAHGHHRGSVYPLLHFEGEHWYELSIAAQGDPHAKDAMFVAIVRDITGRRKAEEALRESEQTYRMMTESMKDVVWILDVEARRFLYVSPAVEKLRGYTAAEILAQPIEEAWAPEQREELDNLMRGYVADFLAGKLTSSDYVTLNILQPCKDGSQTPSEIVCRLLRNERTGHLELHGVTRDISERKRAEAALRESEARFDQVARQSRAFVWEVDAQGLYMFATPVVEDLLGYRPDEIVGRRHIHDLHPEEGREAFRKAVDGVMRRHGEFHAYENPLVTRDGRIVWVSTSAFPLMDRNGALLGYRGIDLDITGRKQAEDALRESEARLRAIHDNLPDGLIYQIDSGADGLQRRFTSLSRGVERMHGITAEQAMADPLAIYGQVIEEDRIRVAAQEAHAAATLTPLQTEVRVRLPSGEIRWRLFTSAPRRLPNGHLVWDGIELDITERKRAEEALRESEASARAIHDNLPNGFIYQMDSGPDGQHRRYTFLSQGVERLHGVTAEQAMADPAAIYGQILEEDLPAVAGLEARALATLTPFSAEVRVRLPSGEIRWRLFTSAPRRLPNGHVVWDGIELDITERKQSEEALRESEARFAAATQASRSFVWEVDPDGLYTYVGDMVAKILGYRPEDLVGRMHFYDLLPPGEREELNRACFDVMARRESSSGFENANVAKDGRLVWLSSSARPLFNADGSYRGYQGIDTDITERKRAEEALQQSEAKYRYLHESMRDAFATADMKGRIRDFNPAFRDLLGYADEELLNMPYRQLTPRKWQASEAKILREQVMVHGYSDVYEKEYVRKNGALVPVELRTILIRDAQGEPAGMWASIRDISERKRAEQALKEARNELERRVEKRTAELEASRQSLAQSEEQFRQMAENVQDAFWLIDARTQDVLYVSPAFERIWKQPAGNKVARWFARIHPDDRERVVQAFQAGMKTGIPGSVTYRLLWPDGSIRWIESSGTMIRDARGRPMRAAGLHRDITGRRHMEEEILKAAEAERQRIGRDLHDSLGQSLTAIGYLAEALRGDLARQNRPEAGEARKLGRLIEQAADQSHALARGLLLADLKRGGLAAALQQLASRTRELLGAPCRYAGPAEIPPLAATTAGQLYRIAQEAVTNAAKHGKGAPIEIRLENGPEGLRLSVHDAGKGISPKKRKSFGMGLDIMRYRANLVGATLWIDSLRGQGTTVNCLLPRPARTQEKSR